MIEFAYTCTQCGHDEWREEPPVLIGNVCPECDCPMTAAARRELGGHESE